ncbi:MAG: DUF4230 domain-containing protein [Rhodothermales bacterium]
MLKMLRIQRIVFRVTLLLLLVALGAVLGVWLMQPRWTEEEVQTTVITTLERETPESFLVTGSVTLNAQAQVRNTKWLFPFITTPLSLGTTTATVRLPGRVSYGFDVRTLTPEHIRITEDGIVEVALPELTIYSVEPDLEQIEIQTEVGWARTRAGSGAEVQQAALAEVQRALRAQAEAHLADHTQPHINTTAALKAMLTPALESLGMESPEMLVHLPHVGLLVPEG